MAKISTAQRKAAERIAYLAAFKKRVRASLGRRLLVASQGVSFVLSATQRALIEVYALVRALHMRIPPGSTAPPGTWGGLLATADLLKSFKAITVAYSPHGAVQQHPQLQDLLRDFYLQTVDIYRGLALPSLKKYTDAHVEYRLEDTYTVLARKVRATRLSTTCALRAWALHGGRTHVLSAGAAGRRTRRLGRVECARRSGSGQGRAPHGVPDYLIATYGAAIEEAAARGAVSKRAVRAQASRRDGQRRNEHKRRRFVDVDGEAVLGDNIEELRRAIEEGECADDDDPDASRHLFELLVWEQRLADGVPLCMMTRAGLHEFWWRSHAPPPGADYVPFVEGDDILVSLEDIVHWYRMHDTALVVLGHDDAVVTRYTPVVKNAHFLCACLFKIAHRHLYPLNHDVSRLLQVEGRRGGGGGLEDDDLRLLAAAEHAKWVPPAMQPPSSSYNTEVAPPRYFISKYFDIYTLPACDSRVGGGGGGSEQFTLTVTGSNLDGVELRQRVVHGRRHAARASAE